MKKKIFNENAMTSWNAMTKEETQRIFGGNGDQVDPDGFVGYIPEDMPEEDEEDEDSGWGNVTWRKRF